MAPHGPDWPRREKWPCLSVAQREDMLAHFPPLQGPDLAAPAARQQEQADDVRARSRRPSAASTATPPIPHAEQR